MRGAHLLVLLLVLLLTFLNFLVLLRLTVVMQTAALTL
jgi:hypothetical protein